MTNVYITIGNSDDGLKQEDWYRFCDSVNMLVRGYFTHVYANTYSLPNSKYQNAIWSFVMHSELLPALRTRLAQLAQEFQQDAIALAAVGEVEMVKPGDGDN